MKRIRPALLFLTVLAILLANTGALAAQTAAPQAATAVKATPISATQAKVSWSGDAPVYEVYYKPVNGSFHYFDTVYDTSTILSLAPETTYEITVVTKDGAESEPVYANMPRLSNTREYNYKYQSFELYYTNANTQVDFFEDSSRTKLDRVSASLLAGAGVLREFFVLSRFSMSGAKHDKDLNYLIVLYPPSSADRFLSSGVFSIPGSWTSAQYAYHITPLLSSYVEQNGSFAAGRYVLEVYLNGWLGGKLNFAVD